MVYPSFKADTMLHGYSVAEGGDFLTLSVNHKPTKTLGCNLWGILAMTLVGSLRLWPLC